jgi:Holliday junction resolvase RusA-like endonuclease
MNYISRKITGIPYGRNKTRGDKEAPVQWTQSVIEQTRNLPRINEACILKVTFLLPPNKFPADLPHGPDLDNLLKRFFDALNETVFSQTQGKDSCVIQVTATKTKVDSERDSGALLEILPIKVD